MKYVIYAKCPYCGVDNKMSLEVESTFPQYHLIQCDMEMDGCDNVFAVSLQFQPKLTVYSLMESSPKEETQ